MRIRSRRSAIETNEVKCPARYKERSTSTNESLGARSHVFQTMAQQGKHRRSPLSSTPSHKNILERPRLEYQTLTKVS